MHGDGKGAFMAWQRIRRKSTRAANALKAGSALEPDLQLAGRIAQAEADITVEQAAGHIIAGAFASRLNLELRERLGYTYGVEGGFAAGVDEGQFAIGTSVRSGNEAARCSIHPFGSTA